MASTYWFHGNLSPERLCRFEITDAVGINQRWAFNVLGSAWGVKGIQIDEDEDVVPLWREVVDLSQLILAVYCQRTGHALDVRVDRWVEAMDTPPSTSVVGSVRFDELVPDPEATGQMTTSIRKAELVLAMRNADWRLALYDVHSAHRHEGDDWVTYAYRAIEDCARAVSRHDKRDWLSLHELMETDETSFKARVRSLSDARDAMGHGDRRDPRLAAARDRRQELLEDLRALVGEAYERAAMRG